jgi:hypothetical protein
MKTHSLKNVRDEVAVKDFTMSEHGVRTCKAIHINKDVALILLVDKSDSPCIKSNKCSFVNEKIRWLKNLCTYISIYLSNDFLNYISIYTINYLST